MVVQRRIGSERGTLVHLDQMKPEVLIYHYIETKNLEAHAVRQVFRLTDLVHIIHIGLAGNYSFDNHVFYFVHNFIWVSSILVDNFQYGPKAALVSSLLFIIILVIVVAVITVVRLLLGLAVALLEFIVAFVYTIIGQVNKHVVQVAIARLLVRLCRESGQAFLMDVDAQRV